MWHSPAAACHCCPGPSGDRRSKPLTAEALLAAAAALNTRGEHSMSVWNFETTAVDAGGQGQYCAASRVPSLSVTQPYG